MIWVSSFFDLKNLTRNEHRNIPIFNCMYSIALLLAVVNVAIRMQDLNYNEAVHLLSNSDVTLKLSWTYIEFFIPYAMMSSSGAKRFAFIGFVLIVISQFVSSRREALLMIILVELLFVPPGRQFIAGIMFGLVIVCVSLWSIAVRTGGDLYSWLGSPEFFPFLIMSGASSVVSDTFYLIQLSFSEKAIGMVMAQSLTEHFHAGIPLTIFGYCQYLVGDVLPVLLLLLILFSFNVLVSYLFVTGDVLGNYVLKAIALHVAYRLFRNGDFNIILDGLIKSIVIYILIQIALQLFYKLRLSR